MTFHSLFYAWMHAKSLQSCPTFWDPLNYSLLGSSVHGVLQIILEWVAMPSSRGSFPPRYQTRVSRGSCIAGRFFTSDPCSVQFSHSVVSDSLRPHESQHIRPSCPSPTPRVHSDSRPSSQWCHLAISSSVVPFSSCLQSFPASESFPMSQLFAWGSQNIGVSALASFLPKKS